LPPSIAPTRSTCRCNSSAVTKTVRIVRMVIPWKSSNVIVPWNEGISPTSSPCTNVISSGARTSS
jgi:hypothetical protein